MKVFVEECYSGHEGFHYRMTVQAGPHKGKRMVAYGSEWNREFAGKARNIVQRETGCNRDSIKFEHR